MNKVEHVLLIDDDLPTNYLHEIYLRESGRVEHIHTRMSVDEGINFLESAFAENKSPEFIFIDINLPAKNGFDFLDDYLKLSKELQGKSKIIMCTTSENPRDLERSKLYPAVLKVITKPLTAEKFTIIVEEF